MLNSHDHEEEPSFGYQKIEQYNEAKTNALAVHYKDVLAQIGEDPEREGLIKTPERVAKALRCVNTTCCHFSVKHTLLIFLTGTL